MASYAQRMNEEHKGLVLFLIDQSRSMADPWATSPRRKADETVRALSDWLSNLVAFCTSVSGVKDYLDVALLGYRTDPDDNPVIEPALAGNLQGKWIVPIGDLAQNPAGTETVQKSVYDEDSQQWTEIDVKVPVWIEPVAAGAAPLCHAFYRAHELASGWIEEHAGSFPPIVVNFTVGQSEDGDPTEYAQGVQDLATEDGNLLLLQCYLSAEYATPLSFPSLKDLPPDVALETFFQMSSLVPEPLLQASLAHGFDWGPGTRGFSVNGNLTNSCDCSRLAAGRFP